MTDRKKLQTRCRFAPQITQQEWLRRFIQNQKSSDLITCLVIGAMWRVINLSRDNNALGLAKTLLGINMYSYSYGFLKVALKQTYVGQYTIWVLHVRTKIQKYFVLTVFKMLDSKW